MVLKFLGLGKKSEYFLEAEPQPSNGSEPAAKAAPAKPQPAPESKAALKAESKPEAESSDSAPAKVAAVAAEATATAAKATEALAEKVTQVTQSVKTTKSTKTKKAAKPEAPAATEKAAPPVAKVDTTSKPASTTFATDHLLPLSTPRRRPGPSLDVFKDMARQVNNRK